MKKQSISRLLTSLFKGIIRGKRKEAVAMESYLDCIPIIQKLVDNHQIGINLKERLVLIDIHLHTLFLPKDFSYKSIQQADKKYAAFFDKIVAYINYNLGLIGKKDFVDPKNDSIHFFVIQKEIQYMDEEGNPIPVHLQVKEQILFAGLYKNGLIDYKEYDGPQ